MKNVLTSMKGLAAKGIVAVNAAAASMFMTVATAMADGDTAKTAADTAKAATASETAGNTFQGIAQSISDLVNTLFAPVMTIVVAVGVLYCIMLGLKFAKAEEPQEHEKAKNHLKNAIIGFALIFILIVVLRLGTPALITWMNSVS